jgi:hypothetical protein
MNSDELTTEQATQMPSRYFGSRIPCIESSSGWKNRDSPRTVDANQYAIRAYDAVCSFGVDRPYLSCKSRVGKTRKEK